MKLMIVDDEPYIREGLKKLINWEEYNSRIVAEAGNALEAIRILKSKKADVIFIDIKMPGMTGLELIEKIKKDRLSDAHIVILTGFADFEYARTAMKLGVTDYLLKPVQTEELKGLLEKVITLKAERIDRIYREQKEVICGLLEEDESENVSAAELLERHKDIEPLIDAVRKKEEIKSAEKKDIMKSIDAYIDEHYRENISLKQLSSIFHLNQVYLGQLFKAKHKVLFKDHINALRIRDAEKMLADSDKRIYEISEELGFSKADTFISKFMEINGMTPNRYRLKNRLKNEE